MKKILVINGKNEQHFEFRSLLESAGFGIYITKGEEDGLKIADRYSPDVIVCNVDDFEKELQVIRILNNNSSTESIPLLLITSTRNPAHVRAAMELGADDVLLKPFNHESILRSVEKRLRKIKIIKEKLTEQIISSENVFSNQQKNVDHVLIKIGTQLKIVEFARIICITSLKEYSKVNTDDNCKIIVRKSIRNWVEVLPPKNFLRIHRGTIINISFLEKIEKTGFRSYSVFLKNISTPFALSQRYSNVMRRTFSI